ncbi:MAG: hypothetical protein QOG67_3032, partial [Verrucomicrobiota bacterium]
FREVGGGAISYCQNSDLVTWSEAILHLLRQHSEDPQSWDTRRARGIVRASHFTWDIYVSKMIALYNRILNS